MIRFAYWILQQTKVAINGYLRHWTALFLSQHASTLKLYMSTNISDTVYLAI